MWGTLIRDPRVLIIVYGLIGDMKTTTIVFIQALLSFFIQLRMENVFLKTEEKEKLKIPYYK